MKKVCVSFAVLLVAVSFVFGFSAFATDVQAADTYKITVPAGPLWSDEDAKAKGPIIAAAWGGKFTGVWTTVIENKMSVVELELPVARTGSLSFKSNVIAGPIWSDDEAKKVGSAIAASYGGTFTGEWHTITEGKMSVIEVEWKY